MKSYYIQTFGCLMNEYDSERVASVLESKGFLPAESYNSADIAILNTCSVREKPQHKVHSYIGVLQRSRRRTGKPVKIGVMGCVAQQEGDALLKSGKGVDFVIGTDGIAHFSDVIERVLDGEKVLCTDWSSASFHVDSFSRRSNPSALVTIMKGCNNYCSYCIVPYVRGVEKSREMDDILHEINALVADGVREVTLLGQNVNSYSRGFPKLLETVAGIDELKRVRFMTAHPKDFNADMAAVIRDNKKICPSIHLPLQSGSDSILKAMNRKYTWDEYYERVLMAQEIIPNVQFSSDFIVGFPGEMDEDFDKTLHAIKTVKYENLYVFNYSPREGTAAAKLHDDVPLEVKTARLQTVNAVQESISAEFYEGLVGSKFSIFVDGASKRDENMYTGRTVHNRIMNFSSAVVLPAGVEVDVTLTDVKRNSLFGEYLDVSK